MLFLQTLYSTDVLKLINISFIPGFISLAIIEGQLIRFDPSFPDVDPPQSSSWF